MTRYETAEPSTTAGRWSGRVARRLRAERRLQAQRRLFHRPRLVARRRGVGPTVPPAGSERWADLVDYGFDPR